MFDLHSFERIAKALADDLVQMHKDTAIELEYWENARLLVEKFYDVKTLVLIGDKKIV
jgi:hypothetical protein